jgi:hypothetical protein
MEAYKQKSDKRKKGHRNIQILQLYCIKKLSLCTPHTDYIGSWYSVLKSPQPKGVACFVNYYNVYVYRWHHLWHVDDKRKEQACTWSIPMVVWRSFEKVLWIFLYNFQEFLDFLVGTSMASLGSQSNKQRTKCKNI